MKGRLFNPTVVTLVAWVCLSPFFLLLVSVLDSHQMPEERKLWFLLGALLLWVLLPIGSGLLWKKESARQIPSQGKAPQTPEVESLEALRNLSSSGLQALCPRLFQTMWPEAKVQPLPQGFTLLLHQGKRLLLVCDAQKTFIGTQEVETFLKNLKQLNCSKGYFMATGLFSAPAIQKAISSSIELVDGEKLYELILTFLKKEEKEGEPPARQSERRRVPRLSMAPFFNQESLKVAFSIPYEPLSHLAVRLENISEGGFCALLENAEKLPKFFHLTLRLQGWEDPIRTLGELLWRQRQESDSKERCGVAFLSLNAQDRLRLRQFIEAQQGVALNERGQNG